MTTARRDALHQWSLWRALAAEPVKYRRTAALRLTVGLPLVYCSLTVLGSRYGAAGNTPLQWERFARGASANWAFPVLPFCTIVLTALASQMMQADRMWTRTLVQPVTRRSAFLAHVLAMLALLLGCSMLLGAAIASAGTVGGMQGPVRWGAVLAETTFAGLATAPTAVLQLWLGTRSPSLALPLIVGNVALFFALILHEKAHLVTYPVYSLFVNQPAHHSGVVGWAAGLTVVFGAVGMLDFARRDFS